MCGWLIRTPGGADIKVGQPPYTLPDGRPLNFQPPPDEHEQWLAQADQLGDQTPAPSHQPDPVLPK